jgi:hypothetical protein
MHRFFLTTKREINIEFFKVIFSGEFITSLDKKFTIVNYEWLSELNILGSYEIFSIGLSRLVERELSWEFLSSKHHWERYSTRIS